MEGCVGFVMIRYLLSCLVVIMGFNSSSSQPYGEVNSYRISKQDEEEIHCLANNVLFEAANESTQGKLAVALVTMNRVKSTRYPDSVCQVVKQKTKNVCQFSWWCVQKNRFASVTGNYPAGYTALYEKTLQIAAYVFLNKSDIIDITKGATHYHAVYVSPKWKGLRKTTKIGRHVFYKEGCEYGCNNAKTNVGYKPRGNDAFISSSDGRDNDAIVEGSDPMDI